MTIRTLIVDDEAPARDELAFLLADHEDVESRQAATADEALHLLETEGADLVFQDIQMPGMGGFQVLERSLELERPPLFVFVTAFDQYAVRAFEAEALDYLLKPVSEERLAACLDRVRQRFATHPHAGNEDGTLARLLRELRGGSAARPSRIPLIRNGRIRLTPPEDVLLFEVDGKRVLARVADDPEYGRHPFHGVGTMAALEERLEGGSFFRIGRSAMVNLKRIAEVAPYHSGKYIVILDDPDRTQVTVGRSRVAELKQRLGLA
ncbi:DNA-binding response regulator [Oceanidesulfovibrio indonesiensis]|uniref:DNA-binding response regulator n=1 Tax=Oceanidesulfovibrio indonesiensis TaxID=54767 RepID=A0A7M3MGM3_9BACT|nr:LytTR family DNA-binding domain-containing protein [Oceanidesulfovibrio indonesiensis]TVM18473.1 DNA-binding response regulator [Oceanidesulfovibrio indonesiensis]